MSVIRWLVMIEVCCRLNLPAILNLKIPLLYAHANTRTSDEHSIVTILLSTRIIFSTYSFKYDFLFSYLSQSQRTALHWASEIGHHETVPLLLQAKADVNSLDQVRVVYI